MPRDGARSDLHPIQIHIHPRPANDHVTDLVRGEGEVENVVEKDELSGR